MQVNYYVVVKIEKELSLSDNSFSIKIILSNYVIFSSSLSNDSFHPFIQSSRISFGIPWCLSFIFVAPSASSKYTVIKSSFGQSPGIPYSDAGLIFPLSSEKLSVTTSFLSGINSLTTPVDQYSFPSGPRMQFKYLPPTLASILLEGQVKPLGPHHFLNCSGSVNAFHTLVMGKSKTRCITISFCKAESCCFTSFLVPVCVSI